MADACEAIEWVGDAPVVQHRAGGYTAATQHILNGADAAPRMQANAVPLLAALLLILATMALRALGRMLLLKPLLVQVYRLLKAVFPGLRRRGGACPAAARRCRPHNACSEQRSEC